MSRSHIDSISMAGTTTISPIRPLDQDRQASAARENL
jgi:hypothetical protein